MGKIKTKLCCLLLKNVVANYSLYINLECIKFHPPSPI